MANLINASEVIAKIPAGHRPDPQTLTPHIEIGEAKHLVDWLGDWYDTLVTEKNGSGLSADNLTFWNTHLQGIAAYAVLHEALPFIAIKIEAAGVMKNFTPDSASASFSEERRLAQAVLDRLNFLKNTAHAWLVHEDRSSNYPDYPGNSSDDCGGETGTISDTLGVVL